MGCGVVLVWGHGVPPTVGSWGGPSVGSMGGPRCEREWGDPIVGGRRVTSVWGHGGTIM